MKNLRPTNNRLSPISRNKKIMGGTPCIRGTRIPVRNIVELNRKLNADAYEIKEKHYRNLKVEDIEYALNWYSH